MNTLKYYFLLGMSLFFFAACEDVIELDLDSTDAQLVIEATLDASQETATVIITKSNDFYDTTTPELPADANITLENTKGDTYNLTENAAGIYVAENVAANPADVFTISVEVDGEVYEASAEVPLPVTLEGVEQLESAEPPFGGDEGSIALAAQWNDPADIESYYRIRAYANDTLQTNTYTVLTDAFGGDGKLQNIPIQERFDENTRVRVELLSTDAAYYDYFLQLSSLVGQGGNSPTPYNPKGNFTNEVLGYFGIYYTSSMEVEL